MKSVEESIQQLADQMLMFCQKSRRQRINQRNRTERLSDLLDWKRMGLEYIKARQLALRRAYPDSFDDDYFGLDEATQQQLQHQEQRTKIPNPRSAPGSPRIRTPLEGVDTELTFAKMSAHDRERYLSYKMQGHDDDEAMMDDVTAMQIKIPFRQRQSTREERLAEGDFDVSEAEVEAAQGDIAQVGHAAATQKQYKDPVGGAKNGQYYQPGAATVGGHNGSYNSGNGYHR